ncbi:DUF5313 domain-containing protein [Mycolicibacterium fluoranthenivorans]|uniref:DUF5313 domain-containing protein n=1 Tax=Mycolicibacterium fluoranthenivorans TaxID=258505 RepID=A0A1G4VL52_9MYCO|nr:MULTISPECIES: DUF5313 domain-containing protein [Mycobacteriaceae]MCV7254225.1 DUF5313 domain-containing protein [Mycobacterium hackensackense]QNJ92617.1 DUF5313 domain-containing protein [Mycolicibacterium fluoranthenivorans]SCX08388.1 hypothetical protein SAMN02799620_01229 [Mycolicibacterium fluoranthenivorans]
MTASQPTTLQYLAYAYGRRLPDSMREWVANDLAGPGAIRRHMIRYSIPPLFILAPLWLLPASLYVHLEMTVPIYFWAVVMAFVLNKIWRRHRLAQHGLDPNLVDSANRERNARLHEDYARRFGPRPESAKWQSNSSPF